MILCVISGGQTGADQAGLAAAKALGVKTGGWAPHGWQTLDGPSAAMLHDLYGLREHEGGYAARTNANARDSDGTLRFAARWDSPGEKCTLRCARAHNRPYHDITVPIAYPDQALIEAVEWVTLHQIQVLNVAGNSERTAPGITGVVVAFMRRLLTAVNGEGAVKIAPPGFPCV